MNMPGEFSEPATEATRVRELGGLRELRKVAKKRRLMAGSFDARSHLVDLSADEVASLEALTHSTGGDARFSAALEDRLKMDWRLYARPARIFLAVSTLLLVAAAPLWVGFMMKVPQAAALTMNVIGYCLMVPLFVILTMLLIRQPTQAATEWFFIFAFTAEAVCTEALRYLSESIGQPVSPSISILVPVAVLAVARLPLSRSIAFVLAYLGVVVSFAVWKDVMRGTLTTRWLLDGLILMLLLISAAWTKVSLRHQWALATLSRFKAYRDTLTMLPNRWAFQQHFREKRETLRKSRYKQMILAVVDVDHFKKLNDTLGHHHGDDTLVMIGRVLSKHSRHSLDIVARTGGDEFMVLLYDIDEDTANKRLSSLIQAVRDLGIRNGQGTNGVVTCSIGAAVFRPGDTLAKVYRRADEMLYESKASGRDQFRIADTHSHVTPFIIAKEA